MILRLRFALRFLDKKEIDKIAKKYIIEHQLLTDRFKGTVQQIVEAFHLMVDNKIRADNYLSSKQIIAV